MRASVYAVGGLALSRAGPTSLFYRSYVKTSILAECFKLGYITHRDGNACFVDLTNQNTYINTRYYVTESGVDKSKEVNFIHITSEGLPLDLSTKVSIETMAHIYALQNTNKTHSLHVHPVYTLALLNKFVTNDALDLETGGIFLGQHCLDYNYFNELEKYPELTRYTNVGVPVDSYPSGSDELHDGLNDSFENNIHIVPMYRHGVMAVGNSFDECLEHCHRLEHVSKIILLGM